MDKYGYEIGGHVLPLDEYLRGVITKNGHQEQDVVRVGWMHYTTTLDRLLKESEDKMVNEHEPTIIPEGLTFVFTNGDVLYLTIDDHYHYNWILVDGATPEGNIDLMDALHWRH